MQFKEKFIAGEKIYSGKIIDVEKHIVALPNQKNAVREVVYHNGGSAILAVKGQNVLLVRQFRYPYDEELWEIPAGKLERGEDPKDTALRELEEEGGYKAEKITLLFEVYPTPAYNTEKIKIYKAENLVKTQTHFDEDEFLESRWFSIDELKKMVENSEIKDAKTLIALLWLFNN